MSRAILAGNAADCERAARTAGPDRGTTGLPLTLCERLPEVVRAGELVRAVRR